MTYVIMMMIVITHDDDCDHSDHDDDCDHSDHDDDYDHNDHNYVHDVCMTCSVNRWANPLCV